MQLSEARIAANRVRSDRPSDLRREANPTGGLDFKRDLCARGVAPEDARAGRAHPANRTLGGWLVDQVVLNSQRIERCQATEQAIRDRIILRARLTWDEDRRLEATLLGGKLASDPERVVARLRETLQGVEWLMARWAMLAQAARVQKTWTPEQTALAFNLAALPGEFREGYELGSDVDFDGQAIESLEDPAAIARREIDHLKALVDPLVAIDQAAREQAEAGLSADSHADLKRHRRYESTLHGRVRWAIRQLEQAAAFESEAATDEPEAVAPLPEITSRVALPTRSASRTEKKLEKAEARRGARRRKLEKLRS